MTFLLLISFEPFLQNLFIFGQNILVTLGTCQYYSGDDLAALMTLQRVHRLDHNHLKGMDILAALFAKERKVRLLNSFRA